MNEQVPEELCTERRKVYDERFARDKERIENLEEVSGQLKDIASRTTTLLEKYDERFIKNEKQLKAHEERLDAIEGKPARSWERIRNEILKAVGSAIGAYLLTLMTMAMQAK